MTVILRSNHAHLECFFYTISACLCRFSLTDAGVTLAIRMLKSTTAQDQGDQSHDQLHDRSQITSNEQGPTILLGKSSMSW